MRKVIWPLSLALLLAGCGGGRMSEGEFQDRARTVAGRWQDSLADRAWRRGFMPLESLEDGSRWERLPAWASLSDHNGVWTLETDLPERAPRARELRWPDGSAQTVPLASAAEAYAKLSEPDGFIEEECPPAGCRKLRVTGAELGEVPLLTSRGRVRVPAWHFTVKGVEERFTRVAVHPSVISPRPVPREGEHEEVTAFAPVPGEDRRLLLTYGHGDCDRTHGARAYETRHLVVVDVDVESGDGMCTLRLKIDQITVTLDAPLGDRVLLDAGNGLPVPPASTSR
ncbi:hypothetical protein ACFOWE_12295 [Planomonospora corallina]|uniref:Lipoprotein n=1 Tax=Planomonospora corallina TaxID=1806052 RepID=A0ABV8I7U8_9ACTN